MEFRVNKIHNIDFVEGIKMLPDNSIDLIVTDPPYRGISGGRSGKKNQPSGILAKNDGKLFDHNEIKPETWFPELYRVLKPQGHCYIMTNTINLRTYLNLAYECEFLLHNLLVWQKNNATPNRWYMKNAEYVLFLRKGSQKSINNMGSKTVHSFINVKNKKHPTEKPISLMKFYIENSSRPGDVVFDPFMGSGTTAVAAIETGRHYIGFELSKEYCDIANARIAAEEKGGVMVGRGQVDKGIHGDVQQQS